MSSSLNDLNPYVKYLANKFLEECNNQNFNNNQSNSPKSQDLTQLSKIGFKDAKVFQQTVGLAPDGILGPKSNSAIIEILNKPLCKKGSTGVAVRFIQYKVGGQITGTFDDNTLRLVKSWQSNKKLTSDGIVGDMTWKSFFTN